MVVYNTGIIIFFCIKKRLFFLILKKKIKKYLMFNTDFEKII